jgi:hypothetical protein
MEQHIDIHKQNKQTYLHNIHYTDYIYCKNLLLLKRVLLTKSTSTFFPAEMITNTKCIPCLLFQNTSLTWGDDKTYPGFTECFQNSVIIWIPSGWLWLSLPFYLPYLFSQKSGALPNSWKNLSKLVGESTSILIHSEFITDFPHIKIRVPAVFC